MMGQHFRLVLLMAWCVCLLLQRDVFVLVHGLGGGSTPEVAVRSGGAQLGMILVGRADFLSRAAAERIKEEGEEQDHEHSDRTGASSSTTSGILKPKPPSQRLLRTQRAAAAWVEPATGSASNPPPELKSSFAGTLQQTTPTPTPAPDPSASTNRKLHNLPLVVREANRASMEERCRDFSNAPRPENGLGVITSPNFPENYPTNIICTRLIEAPKGHYIKLGFRDQFSIEEDKGGCANDRLEIRDGRFGYSKVLAKYCGNNFPPEVNSSGEAMWLRFISDASITSTGFKIVYEFVPQKETRPSPPQECRFDVTASSSTGGNNTDSKRIHSGVIKHTDVPESLMNYTKQYNVPLECIWNISVMPGWKIYLTYSNYELSKPNDCDSNFIEIYEENLTEGFEIAKYCGTRTEPQQSKSNVFNIRHFALPNASNSHFEIIYTAFRDKGNGECGAKEFDCDDGTCIDNSLKCDGQDNCKYRYDEAPDPGPCIGEVSDSFFETEHMVIILIVFLSLVSGMCASILFSCWGKIQERRRGKQDYRIRKSREVSMEADLNQTEQKLYGSKDGSGSFGPNGLIQPSNKSGLKQRTISAGIAPAEIGAVPSELDPTIDGARSINDSYRNFDNLRHQQHQQPAQPINVRQIIADHQCAAANHGTIDYHDHQQANHQLLGHNSSLDLMSNPGARDERLLKFVQGKNMPPQLRQQFQDHQQQQAQQQANLRTEQQIVPEISFNNNHQSRKQFDQPLSSSGSIVQPESFNSSNNGALRQQQMLNFHQQQSFTGSIYQQQEQIPKQYQINDNIIRSSGVGRLDEQNDDSSANDQYGRSQFIANIPSAIFSQLNSSAQTMPVSLSRAGSRPALVSGHLGRNQGPLAHGTNTMSSEPNSQFASVHNNNNNTTTNDSSTNNNNGNNNNHNHHRRALTLSTMHQPTNLMGQRNPHNIYGFGVAFATGATGHPLSSSITCCNALTDYADETPLISDLRAQASMLRPLVGQQQQQLHQQAYQVHQAARGNTIYGSRPMTSAMGHKLPVAAIPRSISAHQLSKSHQQLRQQQQQQFLQHNQQQQQQLQIHHQTTTAADTGLARLQHQDHQRPCQIPMSKALSEVAASNRILGLPNHSLSYPHTRSSSRRPTNELLARVAADSPALPPPPPPPNLVQSKSGEPIAGQQQQQQLDSRRSAFQVSRLNPSQLTGDTLQESDVMLSNMPLGSFQFDDNSTESDATFGLLMNSSIGNTPMVSGHQHLTPMRPFQGHQTPVLVPPPPLVAAQGRKPVLLHLSDCNFIRQQRSQMNSQTSGADVIAASQTMMVCDCGAMKRAKQVQQQQLHNQRTAQLQQAASSSREFDDSEEAAICGIRQQPPGVGQQQHLYHHAPQMMPAGGRGDGNQQIVGVLANSTLPNQMNMGTLFKPIHHSALNGSSLYGRQQQFARLRHQSSELTGDDDLVDDDEDDDDDAVHMMVNDDEDVMNDLDDDNVDEDDEDEFEDDDYGVGVELAHGGRQLGARLKADDDDDDMSSDMAAGACQPNLKHQAQSQLLQQTRTKSVMRTNEQQLRDTPSSTTCATTKVTGSGTVAPRQLSGSRASLSCQSCTCGSQLQLDQQPESSETTDSAAEPDGGSGGQQERNVSRQPIDESRSSAAARGASEEESQARSSAAQQERQ